MSAAVSRASTCERREGQIRSASKEDPRDKTNQIEKGILFRSEIKRACRHGEFRKSSSPGENSEFRPGPAAAGACGNLAGSRFVS